jgi:uncharacterized repeat protein (TIGR01451 family)
MEQMIKKMIKTMMVLLALMIVFPMTVRADASPAPTIDPNPYDPIRLIQELYATIDNLQQQLRDAQRPAPTPVPRVFAPNVKLLSSPVISAEKGETVAAELTVKNIGTSAAFNVLTQASSADGPFSVSFVNNSNSVSTINENATHDMRLVISVDENAKAGVYSIKLDHSYRTQDRKNETSGDTISIHVTGQDIADTKPQVVLVALRADRTLQVPGGSFTITAPIENLGDGVARNVQVSLDPGLDTKTVFLTSDINNAFFNNMPPGYSGNLVFTFSIHELARNGTYPIVFNLSYRDENGERLEESYTYFMNINVQQETRTTVEIKDIIAPDGVLEPGQNGLFTFQVFNTGHLPAQNIKITATASDETAVVPKSSSVHMINSLPAETGRLVSFTFSPTVQSATRSYNIGFLIEYESGVDEENKPVKFSFQQYASIAVHNPEDKKEDDPERLSKPRMIVSAYSVEPLIVQAGREFNLNLTFMNASAEKAVHNIKVTLKAMEATERKGAVFTPMGGSNTYFIDRISPKGEVTQVLHMYTVPDAEARTYTMEVTFDYQDEDNHSHTESELISVNVKQTTRLEITEPYIQEFVNSGDRVNFWFNIINSGRVTLSNLRVRVDGPFDTSEADMFIGNLGRGNQISYDGVIIPREAGKQEGAIVVFGEDDTGELVEHVHKFMIEVTDMSGMDGDWNSGRGMDGDFGQIGGGGDWDSVRFGGEEQTPFRQILDFIKNPWFWAPFAAVVLAAVSVIVMVIRRKNNKAADFDE